MLHRMPIVFRRDFDDVKYVIYTIYVYLAEFCIANQHGD